ncbi:MAG: dipeptidase [Hyphomicrobiales bacterium]
MYPIIDGHNDVLLRLWQKKTENPAGDFLAGDGLGQMDLPRIRAGNMTGGFFAIFSPPVEHDDHDDDDLNPPYAGALSQKSAERAALGMLDFRDAILAQAGGSVLNCLTAAEMRAAMADGALAMITHIEGAEAISPDLSNLQHYHDRGLRSLGPVWSRPNAFGVGVPFRFPSSPDVGAGLTKEGEALVRECNRLRIMVDCSHITERGFWDVARVSTAPLVATHSNAHALSASSRNLTDEQLRAIGQTGGMVGLNFANGFLRADGLWASSVEPAVMLRHLDHMIRLAGEDCVGLGSDFDGARIPGFIKDVSGLPRLVEAMDQAGFGAEMIAKLTHQNWLRLLEKTWGM